MSTSRRILLRYIFLFCLLFLVPRAPINGALADTGENNEKRPPVKGESDDPKVCQVSPDHLKNDSGVFTIPKGTSKCSIIARDDATFFGLKTTHLKLGENDSVEFTSSDHKTSKLLGPLSPGYLVSGYKEPTITFSFEKPSTSDMQIEFIQPNEEHVPFVCDTKIERVVQVIELDKFSLTFSKTTKEHAHVQILGSTDPFGHYLLKESLNVSISLDKKSSLITVKCSPVLPECSEEFSDNKETSQEITGPKDPSKIETYACLNIFKTNIIGDEAHFDVDFANFIKFSNSEDTLMIHDGKNLLNLAMLQTNEYVKKVVSFEGKELAVLYTSPGQIRPTNVPFKLTVRSRENGGIVSSDKDLVIPKKGDSLYTLVPQAGKVATINLDKVSGLQIIISGDLDEKLVLDNSVFVPPLIISDQPDKKIIVNLVPKDKPSGKITFKSADPSSTCGGIFYGSSGAISESGGKKTCYWLLGSPNSLMNINYNDLFPNGFLEIYSLKLSEPIYKGHNISQATVLPKLYLEQAYVKLSLEIDTKFQASLSPVIPTYLDVQQPNRRNITSVGFPLHYPWAAKSDTFTLDSTNKFMVLSVPSLDIRKGEKLLINDVEYPSENLVSSFDTDISNKVTTVVLKRLQATDDISFHKGFKLIATEFNNIMVADMSKDTITTPGNLTSVLIKIQASPNKRVDYKITFKTPEQDYQISVIDSRTLVGRRVYDDKFQGSTTSDTLLVSVIANKKGSFIPSLSIQYKQLDCNGTADHMCDKDSRCVPADKLCKGKVYCKDESDSKVVCSGGPAPSPKVVEKGIGGFTVFVLCVLMFTFGVIGALYGPDLYRNLDSRFRSGRYTTFSSTE